MLALIALKSNELFVKIFNVLYKCWEKSFCEQTNKVSIANHIEFGDI